MLLDFIEYLCPAHDVACSALRDHDCLLSYRLQLELRERGSAVHLNRVDTAVPGGSLHSLRCQVSGISLKLLQNRQQRIALPGVMGKYRLHLVLRLHLFTS